MEDKTLYIVSGFMRTGTSMMMKALEFGGMKAVYRQSRDQMKNRFSDGQYDPNVGGLYELERRDYQAWDFPKGYEGKLIKGLNFCVPRMNVMHHGVRVIFMRRDTEEIRQSYMAFFGKQLRNIEHVDRNMRRAIALIHNRKDVLGLDVFWYRDVVNQPAACFTKLQEHKWPINVQKATSVVNPDLCRFRKEKLTIGVI